jgi:hypothetical protein
MFSRSTPLAAELVDRRVHEVRRPFTVRVNGHDVGRVDFDAQLGLLVLNPTLPTDRPATAANRQRSRAVTRRAVEAWRQIRQPSGGRLAIATPMPSTIRMSVLNVWRVGLLVKRIAVSSQCCGVRQRGTGKMFWRGKMSREDYGSLSRLPRITSITHAFVLRWALTPFAARPRDRCRTPAMPAAGLRARRSRGCPPRPRRTPADRAEKHRREDR